jgi:hypothetical protein
MIDVFVPLLFEFIHFLSKLPLVLFTVFDLSNGTHRATLWENCHVLIRILHNHVAAAWLSCSTIHIFTDVRHTSGRSSCCSTLQLHDLALLLESLRIRCNTSKLRNPLLLDLSLLLLSLSHVDLCL